MEKATKQLPEFMRFLLVAVFCARIDILCNDSSVIPEGEYVKQARLTNPQCYLVCLKISFSYSH